MKKILVLITCLLTAVILFSSTTAANIGVGVNTGKIQVEEKLKAGMIYKLPPITIINTGDEPAEYGTSISFHAEQPELLPKQEWFSFNPDKFHLEPGKAQLVEITINLPIKIEPGNYFAYLEGHPVATMTEGTTTLGVAAASKLYFTVVPANIFYGIYYKLITFWEVYAPWPQRVAIFLGVILALLAFKKFFKIEVKTKKPKEKSLPRTTKDK
ncbi:MAG: hypothetical protein V1810_02375 [Candidatus Beckwithbacteria bacterium]